MQNPDGRVILYNKHKLDNNCRKKLVRIIIDYLLVQADSRSRFPQILQEAAEEIVNLFPSERKDSYFIPYTADKGSTRKFPARGKLYSRWVNLKRTLTRSMNVTDNFSKETPIEKSEPISESEKSSYNAVSQSPGDEFEECLTHWNNCFKMRQMMRSKTFDSPLIYFNHFSALRNPFGYKLLTSDFAMKYPNARNISIHKIWPSIGLIVIDLLKNKTNQVPELESKNADKNFQSLKIFPYLFSPSQLRNKISNKLFKISKAEMSERFFLRVQDFSDLDTKIAERKQKIKETGSSIQPFMVAVGPLSSIQAYFVVVDDQKYLAHDCLSALDATFKIFHALDIPYAIETKAMWQTIDYLVYRVTNFLDPSASVVVGDIERGLNMNMK